MKPKFEHNCSGCTHLDSDAEYDYYFCRQGGANMPTVIARYGNRGHEYCSGLHVAESLETLENVSHETGLVRALHLAREKGFVK